MDLLPLTRFFVKCLPSWAFSAGALQLEGNRTDPRLMGAVVFLPLVLSSSSPPSSPSAPRTQHSEHLSL